MSRLPYSPTRFVHMLERPRHPQQKFRLSLSRGLEVLLRKLGWPRLEEFCLSGRIMISRGFVSRMSAKSVIRYYRDGIARVHGLANVQAEELVE